MYQDIDADVSGCRSLELSLDVYVGYHTLKDTGWWSKVHGGHGEMPVHVGLWYLDSDGKKHLWIHGFLIGDAAQSVSLPGLRGSPFRTPDIEDWIRPMRIPHIEPHGPPFNPTEVQEWIKSRGDALLNQMARQPEFKTGGATIKNFTLVPPRTWGHFAFEVMDDTVRRDPSGDNVLPRPVKLVQLSLCGDGWDFQAGVGNVVLRAE